MASAVMSPPAEAGTPPDIKIERERKPALTPPTSEGTNKKDDDSGSELSDLEPEGESFNAEVKQEEVDDNPIEEDDEAEIFPDHYYDDGNVPVFKPTMAQFRSFKKFILKIDKYGMKSGIVKVIPPPEWRESLPDLDEMVKTIRVKNPITQEFHGGHGTYTQANMEKQRAYNLPQWKALCEESNHQPPAKRGERRLNQDRPARGASSRVKKEPVAKEDSASNAAPTPSPAKRGRKPAAKGRAKTAAARRAAAKKTTDTNDEEAETSPAPSEPVAKKPRLRKEKVSDDEDSRGGGRQPKSVSSRRMRNRQSQVDVVDEEAFKDFDYRVYNQDEWTKERLQELETAYWRGLTFNNPMYGADMPGSLFKDSTKSWNVAQLENLLDVLGQKVPGVNTAYLYLGMWKATFAWHLEDVDLYSINYIHFGAPKQWYSISQADARRFERAMSNVWPNDAKNCDQFLRHKTYLISPQTLQSQYNIKVNRLVHNEGEFVITFPYGYHSGYNLGYNCAESVNFATDSWLEFGRIAKKCNCEADSVWIDVREIERKLRGEPTPEYYEETEEEEDEEIDEGPTDLPTPPNSIAGKTKTTKKRKRPTVADKDAKPKLKKIRIKIRVPSHRPCVLCPNDYKHEPLLPTDNGKKAHRRCGLYTPETWVADVKGVETVCNVAHIDKARLDMKCQYCRDKYGAKFQCSFKKCTRGFHATCAAQAGVLVDMGPAAVFGEDGTEYSDIGFDFRCRYHRSKRGKNMDSASLEDNSFIRKQASKLVAGDLVQAQFYQQEIFAGTVVANRKDEEMLEVDLLPKGGRIEVEYKWLCILDPINSNRQLPSENAKPMPAEILRNTLDAPPPAADDPVPGTFFCEGHTYHKWSEFSSRKPFINTAQVKVDVSKPEQLIYYLGETSTELRPQFTYDPAIKKHNPKCLFMETVRPVTKRPSTTTFRRSYPASFPTGINQNAINAARANSQPKTKEKPYSGKYAITDPVTPFHYRNANNFNPREYQPPSRNVVDYSPHHYVQQNLAGGYSNPPPFNTSAHTSYNLPSRPVAPSSSTAQDHYTYYNYGVSRIAQVFSSHADPRQQPPPTYAAPKSAQQPRNAQPAPIAKMTGQPPPKKLMLAADSSMVAVESPLPTPSDPHAQGFAIPTQPTHSAKNSLSSEASFIIAAPKIPEKKGVSHLKIPEDYHFLHEAERNRPKVYQSPYAAHGGFTPPWAPMPDALPKLRKRGPSMSEEYLAKIKPSQQETIAKNMNESRAKLQMENHERVQRRLSQSQNRPSPTSYFPQHPPYGHQPKAQHLNMSAIQDPNFHNTMAPMQGQPSAFDAHRPGSSHRYPPPYAHNGPQYPSGPYDPYNPLTHNNNPYYAPVQHNMSPKPGSLNFASPQDFRAQMESASQHQQHGHPAQQAYQNYWNGAQSTTASAGIINGHDGTNHAGVGQQNPPHPHLHLNMNMNMHNAGAPESSVRPGSSGSPLKNEFSGGGETLPMMRDGSRF